MVTASKPGKLSRISSSPETDGSLSSAACKSVASNRARSENWARSAVKIFSDREFKFPGVVSSLQLESKRNAQQSCSMSSDSNSIKYETMLLSSAVPGSDFELE